MIESFHIRNYRGFSEFNLSSLGRVNLITGANNVGKTALLEALYLNLGPGIAIKSNMEQGKKEDSTWLNLFRGFKNVAYQLDNISKWGWLFFQKDLSREIELTAEHSDRLSSQPVRLLRSQSLRLIWRTSDQGASIPLLNNEPFEELHVFLDFTAETKTGETHKMRLERAGSPSQWFSPLKVDLVPLRLLFNSSARQPEEDTKWFSRLADVGRQGEVENTLRLIEPRLKNLAVSTSDGPALVYGDLSLGRRIPLSQMGDGMTRLLSLVLEISNASGGVLLIDEIETGLHHSVLKKIWQAIAVAARASDTQIFATTHSWECIRAAHEAFRENESYDLRLHRLDRIDGNITAVTFDENTLETSVEMSLEVR